MVPSPEYTAGVAGELAEAAAAGSSDEEFFPAMPTVPNRQQHRDHVPCGRRLLFNAVVARPVSRKEISTTPKAQEAQGKEWGRLRERKVWDESILLKWEDAAAEAQ